SFKFTVTDRGDPDNCGPMSTTCAAALSSSEATVSITVVAVNDKPTADAQSVNTSEDMNLPVTLTGSDLETGPANLGFTGTVNPAHGSLTGTAPNVIYHPASNYNGPDSFQFKVTDRGDPDNCSPGPTCAAPRDSDDATVSIVVSPVNDKPYLA